MNNNSGGLFSIGNNKPLRGGNNNFQGGEDNGHPSYQIPRSYVVGPTWSWIRPTWNPWYLSWYLV
jgi:hypothetical protein